MKKLFLLIPALVLVGCSSAKSVDFKNLKFDKPLNAEQLEEFEKKFGETAETINGFKISSMVKSAESPLSTASSNSLESLGKAFLPP